MTGKKSEEMLMILWADYLSRLVDAGQRRRAAALAGFDYDAEIRAMLEHKKQIRAATLSHHGLEETR